MPPTTELKEDDEHGTILSGISISSSEGDDGREKICRDLKTLNDNNNATYRIL